MRSAILAVSTVSIVTFFAGCAAIRRGSEQQITLGTNPPGATCMMNQGGVERTLDGVSPTEVIVDRRNQPLQISCTKAGYRSAQLTLNPELEPWTVANLGMAGMLVIQRVAGVLSLVGFGVDSATGSWNVYPETVNMTLSPNDSGEPIGNDRSI